MLAGNLKFRRCHNLLVTRAHRCSVVPCLSIPIVFYATNFNNRYVARHPAWPCSHPVASLSTTATACLRSQRKTESLFLKPRGKPKFRMQIAPHQNDHSARQAIDEVHHSELKSESSTPPHGSSRLEGALPRDQTSTTDLERELYYLAHNDPDPIGIHSILKILIHNRQIRPESQHYEALILANTWPEYGSVGNVESALAEMEAEDIEIGPNIIAAVLKVLAVHPSPELSHRMIAMAERRWVPTSSQTHHHLVLAMIRTGQTELAARIIDWLMQNQKDVRIWNRDIVPDYLVVLLIVQMVEMGDWEGVLQYFYKLRDSRAADREIPTLFWGWLLERASKPARAVSEAALQMSCKSDQNGNEDKLSAFASHLQAQLELSNPALWLVSELWSYYASVMSTRPSWSSCLDILHAASNTGILWLARSVLATMTYLDGIDVDTGLPRASDLSADLSVLVKGAEQRARDAETPINRDERVRKETAAREKERQEREDEKWWDDLMQNLEQDDPDSNGKLKSTEGRVPSDADADAGAKPQTPSTTASSTSHRTTATVTATVGAIYPPFNPDLYPPGNLWPFFPSLRSSTTTNSSSDTAFTKVDNVNIDPWTALGPRSATRGRWTDGQKRQKERERAALRRKTGYGAGGGERAKK